MKLNNILKKILKILLPSYRVSLRNEEKLNITIRELKNTKKEVQDLKKFIKTNFTNLDTKLENFNFSEDDLEKQRNELLILEENQYKEFKEDEISFNRDYQYKFSIVMAVYNVEPFIKEAIESILNQDIGFENNIQLILVDDGSTDNSGEICDKYQNVYPDNIFVIHKTNGGVSSARNAGLPLIKGKYINFTDADDVLSLNTLDKVLNFFEIHYYEIDVCVIPLEYFDGKLGEHTTDKEIFSKGQRIIDLNIDYKCVLMSISRAFIKNNKSILDTLNFDEKLEFAEDARELQKILLNKQKFGAIIGCKYLYRKRIIGELSALDNSFNKKSYYIDYLKYYSIFTIDNTLKNLKELPNYVQYTLLYDLQWKFKLDEIPNNVLDLCELKLFKTLLKDVLNYIDDNIIMQAPNIFIEYKLYILNFKYGKFAQYTKQQDDVLISCNNIKIRLLSQLYTKLDFIKYENSILSIEGRTICFNCSDDENIDVFANINDQYYLCQNLNFNENKYSMGSVISKIIGFKIDIEIKDSIFEYNINFYYKYRGLNILRKEISFEKFCPIGKELENSYYYKDGRVLTTSGYTLNF